jgi:hypothetical protein
VIPAELVWGALDQLHREAVDLVTHPPGDRRDAFGFGQVSGMLQAIVTIRNAIEVKVNELAEAEALSDPDRKKGADEDNG